MSETTTPIYLDGFATMPLAVEARDAMLVAWSQPGNAGSLHQAGERAAAVIAEARSQIAQLINASPGEITFTSGATEANNLAILGVAAHATSARRRIVISSVEHKSVLEPAVQLGRLGIEVAVAPVDRRGRLDVEAFARLMGEDVLLASVMSVNNETGVLQPISEAVSIARRVGALFHTDAAQAVGKVPVNVLELDVDYLSVSAHKLYGPVGVGALFVAAGSPMPTPLMFGGGQQNGRRPGTEPAPLIAGFGAAAKAARKCIQPSMPYGDRLVGVLLDELQNRQVRFERITGSHPVAPGTLAIRLPGINADALCLALANDVCVSTGSACNSGQLAPSHVLVSMGYSYADACEIFRVACPRNLNEADMRHAGEAIATAVALQLAALDGFASPD